MAEPERAPKKYCAARPPAPWHSGMAPHLAVKGFMSAMERAKEVVEGAEGVQVSSLGGKPSRVSGEGG